MSRIVLLGLGKNDVDVLSRIPRNEPRPEVLVAHPDPTALVLQLASLSRFPTTTSPPTPRKDDVVVIPAEGGTQVEEWVDAFKVAGATIVSPESLAAAQQVDRAEAKGEAGGGRVGSVEDVDDLEPVGGVDIVDNGNAVDDEDDVLHVSGNGLEKEARLAIVGTESPEKSTPRIQEQNTMRIETPPVDIWSDPEATFNYLIERSLGRSNATLWWDGGIDVWVPWMRTGSSPVSNEKSVIELPSSFGSFRLTGTWADYDAVPVTAVTRVAEDIALRDLAAWQKAAAKLPGLRVPREQPNLGEWAKPILKAMDPEAAWLWEGTPAGWKLRLVHGQDVAFSGELTVSQLMMDAMFSGEELHWERWRPADHVSIQLGFSKTDGRWPLRWERVKKALSEKR